MNNTHSNYCVVSPNWTGKGTEFRLRQGGWHQSRHRIHALERPYRQQMGCGHSHACCCCARCNNARCYALHPSLVGTPVGTFPDIRRTLGDQGWLDSGWEGLETLANGHVWEVVLGKTTQPSAAKAEQYGGTVIPGLPQSC